MITDRILNYGYNVIEGARICLMEYNTFGDVEVTDSTFKKNEGVVGMFRTIYSRRLDSDSDTGMTQIFEYYVDNKVYSRLSIENKRILLEYILQANRLAPNKAFSLHPAEVQETLLEEIDDNIILLTNRKRVMSFISDLEMAAVNAYNYNKSWFRKTLIYSSQCKDKHREKRRIRIKNKFK